MINLALLLPSLLLLAYFALFAAHNYANAVAALSRRRPARGVGRADARVAVVIVSFNERAVIADTIAACEKLSYSNKTIIVGDDSKDPQTIQLLRELAADKGCAPVPSAQYAGAGVELWEGEHFVLFHRHDNVGFKAGNLKALEGYLREQGFAYLYLLDSDWRPQRDVVERCLQAIDVAPDAAFVQTKRLYPVGPRDHFQRCLALNEEACYVVDLPGRQRLGQMILFSGCCTLFDLSALSAVGGFRAGHLTEDIDLSNRLYLAGYRGIYLEDVVNVGEVPPTYRAFRRQQERWAIGSARTFREYLVPVLRSRLDLMTKVSLLRQNAYYTMALGIELALAWNAVALGVSTLGARAGLGVLPPGDLMRILTGLWLPVLLIALVSTLVPLVVTAAKKREWLSLLYVPMACWIALSVVHTYALANVKGFRNVDVAWFVTPKTNRQRGAVAVRAARSMQVANAVTLTVLVGLYLGTFTSTSGWAAQVAVGVFAVLWIPSMIIASLKS